MVSKQTVTQRSLLIVACIAIAHMAMLAYVGQQSIIAPVVPSQPPVRVTVIQLAPPNSPALSPRTLTKDLEKPLPTPQVKPVVSPKPLVKPTTPAPQPKADRPKQSQPKPTVQPKPMPDVAAQANNTQSATMDSIHKSPKSTHQQKNEPIISSSSSAINGSERDLAQQLQQARMAQEREQILAQQQEQERLDQQRKQHAEQERLAEEAQAAAQRREQQKREQAERDAQKEQEQAERDAQRAKASAQSQPKTVSAGEIGWVKAPHYNPTQAAQLISTGKTQAKLTVQVNFDEQGQVVSAKVARSSGSPQLDQYVLQQTRSARAKPYRIDGVPHSFSALLPINFEINDPDE